MADTLVQPDAAAVARVAADLVVADLQQTIASRGQVSWVIAGGSSPMAAYRLLATEARNSVDWSKVTLVIGDERCVPFDNPDANWTQAEAAFIKAVGVSPATIRPPTGPGAGGPEAAAESYEQYLRRLPANAAGLPLLDVVWLGVGEDGHTLSIFPDHPSFQAAGSESLVMAVRDSPKPPPERISLTFNALRTARHCVILAAGAGKAAVISRALAGDQSLPVARAAAVVEAAGGRVTWLLDEAAAGGAV